MICSKLLLPSLKYQLVRISIFFFVTCQFRILILVSWETNERIRPGVDPKSIVCEFFKAGQCTKGFKCKFSHDLNVQRKGEKIDIYSDKRDEGTA